LTDDQQRSFSKLYKELRDAYPRAHAVQLIPLEFLTGNCFRCSSQLIFFPCIFLWKGLQKSLCVVVFDLGKQLMLCLFLWFGILFLV